MSTIHTSAAPEDSSPSSTGLSGLTRLLLPVYFSYVLALFALVILTYHLSYEQSVWAVIGCGLLVGGGGYILLRRSLLSFQNVLMRSADKVITNSCSQLQQELEEAQLAASQHHAASPTLSEEDQEKIQQLEHSLLSLQKQCESLKEQADLLVAERSSLEEKLQQARETQASLERQVTDAQQRIQGREAEKAELIKQVEAYKSKIEQKQQKIDQLENKVLDLKYEVKTLLELESLNHSQLPHESRNLKEGFSPILGTDEDLGHLEEADLQELCRELPTSSDHSHQSHYDRFVQLQRCVEIAEKMRGAPQLKGEKKRLHGMGSERYLIDLRRLFENLKRECSGIIFLYSRNEGRLLFANNEVRGTLGWSPEKFVKDFPHIVQQGLSDWSQAVATPDQLERPLELVVRTKEGQPQKVSCYLATIPSGAFAEDVIGVLYPAA